MKKIALLILVNMLAISIYAQYDLTFMSNNKPSERHFKYAKYNDLVDDYNSVARYHAKYKRKGLMHLGIIGTLGGLAYLTTLDKFDKYDEIDNYIYGAGAGFVGFSFFVMIDNFEEANEAKWRKRKIRREMYTILR